MRYKFKSYLTQSALALCLLYFLPAVVFAQATLDDYERAWSLQERFDGTVLNVINVDPQWAEDSPTFWYRRSVEDGDEFIWVDAESETKRQAFNHRRLARTLSEHTGESYSAYDLPFRTFEFVNDNRGIEFTLNDSIYTCTLSQYSCSVEVDDSDGNGWSGWGAWDRDVTPEDLSHSDERELSPDERHEAYIQNFNVVIRNVETEEIVYQSTDGSEGNYYHYGSLEWSPDSQKLVANRVIPGYERKIHYVESSPEEQLQPLHRSRTYIKPGDALDNEQPVLIHIESGNQLLIDKTLFPNAYNLSGFRWDDDSNVFTFEYNERGHQRYRIIEVDAESGGPRILVNDEPETFFSYATSLYRYYADETDEIIWMSERDGWRHLYLYDTNTGRLKNQITEGEWVVREVDHVDEENRQIWFRASGMDDNQDPYYIHYFSVDFDGSGLTRFTEANGNHEVSFSADRKYYVDTWSQVDQAPISELRRTGDQSLVMTLEEGDISKLLETGWQAPEQFSAKGRDGETDIYGIIVKPTNFKPNDSYPVIEYIYAGPHDNFVPKSFMPYSQMMRLAELGFIVVQIDGMGTANRSKEFHDVAWQNLKDAGFPDRILWHEAVAKTYEWYDNRKVGIYGRSAGGQSSLGALLFHPEHYHVAVSSVGCHDNRMDKIWWNEQWMGWPIGPQYAASSNVEHAHNLKGNVLLVVGELDTNVDPASTYQVADALIKANKDFDFITIPGAGHGSIGQYEERKRFDYFVEHLQGGDSPKWNQMADSESDSE